MKYARSCIRGVAVFALALGLFSFAVAYLYLLAGAFFDTFRMIMH